jgi:CRISPR-associated protein Cas2
MSRFAVEYRPGVFIADINARVRDKVWDRVVDKWNLDALMIYTTNKEQGYDVRVNGTTSRQPVIFDGIVLAEHSIPG